MLQELLRLVQSLMGLESILGTGIYASCHTVLASVLLEKSPSEFWASARIANRAMTATTAVSFDESIFI